MLTAYTYCMFTASLLRGLLTDAAAGRRPRGGRHERVDLLAVLVGAERAVLCPPRDCFGCT